MISLFTNRSNQKELLSCQGRRFLKVFILLLFTVSIKAQDQDFQIWSSADVQYKWNKKFSFGLEQALRTAHNSLLVDKTFTELKVSYDLPKKMKVAGGYRFIQNYIGEKSLGHRLYADFKYSYKLDRFKFNYRLRYQYQFNNEDVTNTVRNQLKIRYNLPKTSIEPFIAGEMYYTVFTGFDKQRYTVGLSEKFGKKIKGSIYYRFQREVNVGNVQTQNIIGVGISYDLGKRKKKKAEKEKEE